ncbi:hypothetical protein BHE74_00018213 [Ensete ventricosum]|nr:hypothetical protein BHE74_00018213 [Ensete ventricosum]RZR94870.1 hypothetical protein BHM03_00023629 [Ensete ventricosum]
MGGLGWVDWLRVPMGLVAVARLKSSPGQLSGPRQAPASPTAKPMTEMRNLATFHRNLCSSWNLGRSWIDLRVEHTPQRDSHPPLAMTKREGTTSPRKKQRQSTTSTASPNAMAIAVKPAFLVLASHDIKVAHVFAFTVFVWVLHFRGGAARLGCTRTAPIPSSMHTTPLPLPDLHVHPLVMCLGFILVTGEAREVEDASRRLVALLATAVKGLTVVDLDDNVSLVEKERTILLEPQVRQCDRRRE